MAGRATLNEDEQYLLHDLLHESLVQAKALDIVEASHVDSTIARMMGGSFMQQVSRRAIGHSVFGIGVDEDNKYSLGYGIVNHIRRKECPTVPWWWCLLMR